MVIGTGIDIIENGRVRGLVSRHGDRFLRRWFSPREIAYCEGKSKPWIHFAARIAAKEAALKALGLGWKGPLRWRDISVANPDSGPPALELSGLPRLAAEGKGVTSISLSISHCEDYAVASVVMEGPAAPAGG